MEINISKDNVPNSTITSGQIFLDISSIKYKSSGGKKFWALFIDDKTRHIFSIFLKKNSDLATKGVKLQNKIKADHNIDIKIIRCENDGENKYFEKECLGNVLKVIFEYTPSGTPQ